MSWFAYQVLSSAGIRILIGASSTVKATIEMFKGGRHQDAATSGPAGFGIGLGIGRGFGTGMGRGRGMGRFSALLPSAYESTDASSAHIDGRRDPEESVG